jgi:hypothetical protein
MVEQRGYHLSKIPFKAYLSDRYEAYINGVAASPQRPACPGIQKNEVKAPDFMEPFKGDRLSAAGQIARIRRGYWKREIQFERMCRPGFFDLKKVQDLAPQMVFICREMNRAAAQTGSSSERIASLAGKTGASR